MTSIPQALATACHRGRVIPFVGSGVSQSVGEDIFPTWKQLLEKLADRLEAFKKELADQVELKAQKLNP